MSDLRPAQFFIPPTPRKPVLRPFLRKVFGPRRNRFIAGGAALALLLVVGGSIAISMQAAETHRVAVIVAQKKADAKKAAEAKAEGIRQAKADLKEAIAQASDAYTKSVAAATAANSFAEASALTALKQAQDELTALYNMGKPATTDELTSATAKLNTAVTALGTAADAADRAYIAAETASGRTGDTATLIRIARDNCASLDTNYGGDPTKAIDRFLDHQSAEDVIAVTAYCPQYLAAIAAVAAMIPGDGGYAVAAAATGFGVEPQIIAPGTYSTRGAVSECYWEVNDNHGGIIRNNFILSAPGGVTIQVRSGQGFTTQGCGAWTRR